MNTSELNSLPHANWNLLPEHMREGVSLWISHGITPGSFMTAVLRNDLKDALARADDINRARIHDIVSFLYQYAPAACWGSPEKVIAWERSATEKREAEAEAAWDRQQQSLMESGGPDDSSYRRDMIDAGRGHLLR